MTSRPSLAARLARVAENLPPMPEPTPRTIPVKAPPLAKSPAPSATVQRVAQAEPGPSATIAKARTGKTMIAGYFSPEMARAVKMLAVERGVTVQALIGEGLDMVLRQHGKNPFQER